MKLFLYISRFAFLCALFDGTTCHPLEQKFEKRIDKTTELYALSHNWKAEFYWNILTATDHDPTMYDDYIISWEKYENRLIARSTGDLLLSVQTSVGSWLCAIQADIWPTIYGEGDHEKMLRAKVWVDGCKGSLMNQIYAWKKTVHDTFHLHGGTASYKVYGAQVFALSSTSGAPLGINTRSLIIPQFKELLGSNIDYVPLMGWPQMKNNKQTEVGFVVVQEPTKWSPEDGHSAIVKIYSTGTGPDETGIDGVDSQRPYWGTYPAIEMKLSNGVPIDDCGQTFIFRGVQRLDEYGRIYPDAEETHPKNPYY